MEEFIASLRTALSNVEKFEYLKEKQESELKIMKLERGMETLQERIKSVIETKDGVIQDLKDVIVILKQKQGKDEKKPEQKQ